MQAVVLPSSDRCWVARLPAQPNGIKDRADPFLRVERRAKPSFNSQLYKH
jgi:hypothetical protein